ncbi:thiamine phosphate synthase [Phenylobacterium sp.]|uniref:thiamine phosphate synthase n=1 Tax=Phenylobacterium sp. TaxID=1871053 RepID=UPI0025FE7F1D|nr:thiamine phosphate synthase [Phenylobacterium sp.]
MQRTARLLAARRRLRKALPALLFFTDPVRTPDPEAVARRLAAGSAIVYRAFGAPDAEARARRLKAIARSRGLTLLIGQDWGLAHRVGADGVHLPERLAHRAGPLKRANPGWIVTSAAHSLAAARRSGADAVVLSVALPSRSTSAAGALGPIRLAIRVRAAGRAAYALGGINDKTARRLRDSGLIGLAAVEGLAPVGADLIGM